MPPILMASPEIVWDIADEDNQCWADAFSPGSACCREFASDRLGLCPKHADEIIG